METKKRLYIQNIANDLIEVVDEYDQLKAERDQLDARNQELIIQINNAGKDLNLLAQENMALRAGQGTWPTERPDDFPCCSGEQVPERLTVADLDAAPVGSVLSSGTGSRFGQKFTKYATGKWAGDLTALHYTSRELESCGHSVLTYPDPAPVTAEAIRASEPGSTWDDKHGAAWEWTGDGLAYHSQFGDLGEESLTDYVVQQSGPFTRSTAAPRGDYGKPELPTVGEVIDTPEQVELLPDDTIIKPERKLGVHGFAQQKIHGNCWMEVGDEREVDDRTITAHYLPATILHLPAKVVTDE